MTMNPLPPQAYTKETLLRAYQWLQAQPSSIREMAMTPDILVSLYLKASREGDQALERPSIQNFKQELKSLASLMGDLDNSPQAPRPSPPKAATPPPPPTPQTFVDPPKSAPSHHFHVTPPQPMLAAPAPAPPAPPARPAPSPTIDLPMFISPSVETLGLDSKTTAMVREIQDDFNLSCEAEALRMIVKIGYSKAKSLMK